MGAMTRFWFATGCVSSAVAKLAPALVVLGAWAKDGPSGTDPGTSPARSGWWRRCGHFQYAVGFYASAGARHLGEGRPGTPSTGYCSRSRSYSFRRSAPSSSSRR